MKISNIRGATRRDFMKFGAASAVASSLPLTIHAATANSRLGSRFLLDCHIHVGGSREIAAFADQVHTPADYLAVRGKQPEAYAEAAAQPQIDNSDDLVAVMDQKGVTHGLIQPTPGNNADNRRIAEVASRYKGRLFPLYRPEALLSATGTGNTTTPDEVQLRQNTLKVVDEIENEFPKLGIIGMGEFIAGGFVTTALDPKKISRDMAPIMEALSPKGLPIMLPTGTTGFKGNLSYVYDPIWIDELAGNFPNVPIVMAKMGRGIRASFDACLTVAKRNANIYFDLTDSRASHIREVIDEIGAHRIMFGTDLHVLSLNYSLDVGFEIVEGAHPSEEEMEWLAWRTADELFRLGLSG